MNKTSITFIMATLLMALSGTAAGESHEHHGGHFHYRGHFGVFIGIPFPGYYYPPYYPSYYPPAVVVEPQPPTYVEQGTAQAAPEQAQANWWYYCAESKTYYPYVKQCPGGWQRVNPQPPPS